MSTLGYFYGIGVGPGECGLIPLIAWEALKRCDLIFVPRAKSMDYSVAQCCLPVNEIPQERFREIEFAMETTRGVLRKHYASLAATIAAELRAGKNVAYLTIGDPLTYSTYGYTIDALKDALPDLRHRTFPGITSYCALAAASDFALGESKERVLILPCPDDVAELRATIEANDVVVLMKIGDRLGAVLELLRGMGIAKHCAFGRRIGMPDEIVVSNSENLEPQSSLGYLSTMLIRKAPREKRHVSTS